MFTIAFISASGGAGKTTLAMNTAAALTIDEQRTLFIDLDPSMTATRILLGRTIEECNIKTLMKKLVDYRKGDLESMPRVYDCLRLYKIPNTNAAFYVLPGGNLNEISNAIMSIPNWGLLLKELIDKVMDEMMNEMKYSFDIIILDSPNWVYQFFEMTFPLAPLYVAITRPGDQEVSKFMDFLRRITQILHHQNILIPRNKDYDSLISYVVNQYRSGMKAEEVIEAWNNVHERTHKEFPNMRPLINDRRDDYYGDKKTEFVGFKHMDGTSLDSYIEEGPLYARKVERSKKNEARPVKQFQAYYEAVKQFISEMSPVEVAH